MLFWGFHPQTPFLYPSSGLTCITLERTLMRQTKELDTPRGRAEAPHDT